MEKYENIKDKGFNNPASKSKGWIDPNQIKKIQYNVIKQKNATMNNFQRPSFANYVQKILCKSKSPDQNIREKPALNSREKLNNKINVIL